MLQLKLLTHPRYLSLPADEASTRASLCYLSKLRASYTVEFHKHADACSPDRLLPIATVNGFLTTGFTSLCSTLELFKSKKEMYYDNKKLALKNLHHAYLFWLADAFRNIALYFTWVHEPNFSKLTCERLQSIAPWPLYLFIIKRKRSKNLLFLSTINWDKKSTSDIYKALEGICFGIMDLLGKGPFLFERTSPGKIDFLLYGYWSVFLDFSDYFSPLFPVLGKYTSINDLVLRVQDYSKSPV